MNHRPEKMRTTGGMDFMNVKPFRICILSAILGLPLFAGCGRDKLLEISGAVTYEGQPVQKGTIAFLSPEDKGPTAATVIVAGKYSVKVPPGPRIVRIEGFKVLGQQLLHPNNPSSPKVDVLEPIIPAEYNEKSKLKAEISGNARVFDFHLKKPAGGS
jgi:hypothetical protein